MAAREETGKIELARVVAAVGIVFGDIATSPLLGHERFLAGGGGRMGQLSEWIFALLSRNAGNPSDYFGLPPAQVVEIGARIDL